MQSLNLQYNPRIDQLRWLAATIVFLFHFHLEYRGLGGTPLTSNWAALITEGHTGVGLFFTLSGFLFMQIALAQKTIVYRDFVRNRVLRIFPLFLTIFLVATSIGRDNFQPQDILYLFATNLGHAPTSGTVITGAAWTISLEFLFYLVFPFLARFALERETLKVLIQHLMAVGRLTGEITVADFQHPAYQQVWSLIAAAGGPGAGAGDAAWATRLGGAAGTPQLAALVSALAVESLPSRRVPDAGYVTEHVVRLRELSLQRRIADAHSRLQRTSPTEDPDAYRALFADLAGLEQQRRSLRERVETT